MNLSPLHEAIQTLMQKKDQVLVAIDGPCASGKSTLAAQLGEFYTAPVIHMDDFFLPPEMRTEERLSQSGGNVDSDRFLSEILLPLSQQKPAVFRPWRCKLGEFGDAITVNPSPRVIVEGAYAMRPDLREFYDLRVFLTAPLPLRLSRLEERNGLGDLEVFQNRWIPLENAYFEGCSVEKHCHISLSF